MNVIHSLSLMRRRVTRRLTRLQTMYNVIKFSTKWWNNVKKSIYRNRNTTATQPQILSSTVISLDTDETPRHFFNISKHLTNLKFRNKFTVHTLRYIYKNILIYMYIQYRNTIRTVVLVFAQLTDTNIYPVLVLSEGQRSKTYIGHLDATFS